MNLRIPYREYLETEHWQTVRAETLRLASYRCILCGHGERPLEAHHTDEGYNFLGEEVPGVHTKCLCARCHSALSVGRQVLQGAPARSPIVPVVSEGAGRLPA